MTPQTSKPASSQPSKPGSSRALRIIDMVGVALCMAAAGLCYLAGVRPVLEAVGEQRELTAALAQREAELDDLLAARRAHEAGLVDLRGQIRHDGLHLLPSTSINHQVAALTLAAGEAGLRLDEVRPGTAAPLQHFITVPIRLSGAARYPDAAGFLRDLHSAFPDTSIVGVELRGQPEAPDKHGSFVFDLVWYAAPATAAADN